MIGSSVSHYNILEKIGEGGMGVVYKARDTKLDRDVALKFLPGHLAKSTDDKARFTQEAKAAATLNHPNICTIHDISEAPDPEGGEPRMFIVMEYVEGQQLREKMVGLATNQAVELGIQIADGLAAAHEKGIVHRDIKPENIMVRRDGIVQIMDFGLAKLRGTVTRLTAQGSTVGTAGYMSPEQVQGEDADHRSDIFSLGVLLYELFTGHLPFKGVHATALMYEIVNVDATPMAAVNQKMDPALDAIVLECLVKEIKERYQSAAEVAKALRRFKKESSRQHLSRVSKVTPVGVVDRLAEVSSVEFGAGGSVLAAGAGRSGTASKIPVIILVSLLVAALGVIGWLLRGDTQTPDIPVRFSILPPDQSTIEQLAVSPDGKYLVFSATSRGKRFLWLRSMNDLTANILNGTENAVFPFWSPDSRYLAFFSNGKMRRMELAGGSPVTICDAPNARGGSWNKAGEILFAPNPSGVLYTVPSGGGIPTAVTVLDSSLNELEHIWPQFLPDGEHFIYLGRTVRDDESWIYLSSIGSTDRTRIAASVSNPLFALPSHLMFLKERTLMVQELDISSSTLTGQPYPIAEGVGYVPILGLTAFSVSDAGILVTGGGRSVNREFRWYDRNGTDLGSVSSPGNFFNIALSPTGNRAAVQLIDIQSQNSDIWILDLARKRQSRFTFNPAVEDDAVWSPDGTQILFSSSRDDHTNIYRKRSAGSGAEEPLLEKSNLPRFSRGWSNDGRFIIYEQVDPVTKEDIWVIPDSGNGEPIALVKTEFSELYGQFSPDGNWLVYTSNISGKFEVYVQSFPSSAGKWQVSADGGSQPRWSRDGKEIFYIAPDRTIMALDVRITPSGFEYGNPVPLFETHVDNYDAPERYVVSVDGSKFLINVPVQEADQVPITVLVNWRSELR